MKSIIQYLHVSGSAYKIAKDRAYHHGTMLISSQLSTLGDVLHVSKVRFTYRCTLAYIPDRRDGV
jgi:lipoate-protein ligase A